MMRAMAGDTAILNSKQAYWGAIGQPLMHMCFDALSPLPTTNTTPIASQKIVVIDKGNQWVYFILHFCILCIHQLFRSSPQPPNSFFVHL